MAEEKKPGRTAKELYDWFTRKKWVAWPVFLGSTLLAILIFWNKLAVEWDKAFPQYFDALIYVEFQPRTPSGMPLIWLVDDADGRDQSFCPVGYILNVSITNLQAKPATIVYYEVSVRRPDGNWFELPHIPWSKFEHLYAAPDPEGLEKATLFSIRSSSLDQQLSPTENLKPFTPMVGTALFEDPFPTEAIDAMRITVRDAQEHEFRSHPLHVGGLKSLIGGSDFQFLPRKDLDLRKLTMNRHCSQQPDAKQQ